MLDDFTNGSISSEKIVINENWKKATLPLVSCVIFISNFKKTTFVFAAAFFAKI